MRKQQRSDFAEKNIHVNGGKKWHIKRMTTTELHIIVYR